MAAKRLVVGVERGSELVRPVAPAALDAHHALLVRCAAACHHWVQILSQLLGLKVRHNFRADCGSPILDCPQDAAQPTARDPAPGAIAEPRLAVAGFIACALTLPQGTRAQTRARGGAPPAGAGQGKAPEARFVCREPNDLAPARPVLEGRQVERARGEVGGVGIEAPSGPIGAYVLFFRTPRTRSRPPGTPVCWANTRASARHRHGAWIEPCWRGASSTRRLRGCARAQVI